MLLDKAISLVAPFRCTKCDRIGHLLCYECRETELDFVPSRCYRCHRATRQFAVCSSCRSSVSLRHVWVVASYKGAAKDLLEQFKFERAGGAAEDLAAPMAQLLPLLPTETLVCHIPTASSRVRVRGYDQAKLLAKEISKQTRLQFASLLLRETNSRQVGAGRKKRVEQAASAYALRADDLVKNKNILLVDDVTTSGATLEAAASLLRSAGAASVDAVVFAQAVD